MTMRQARRLYRQVLPAHPKGTRFRWWVRELLETRGARLSPKLQRIRGGAP